MNGQIAKNIQVAFPRIEDISLKVLVEAYNFVCNDKLYDIDWEEEQFTTHLMSYMKKTSLTVRYNLVIDTEIKLIDDSCLPIGDNNPKVAPRIDLRIASWKFTTDKEIKYFFEAKNLSANTWSKKSGAVVQASKTIDRYISTGIDNFRKHRYYDGSILGYVLEGNVLNVVDALNKKLNAKNNTLCPISNIECVKNFSHCYKSEHLDSKRSPVAIKHIFFTF